MNQQTSDTINTSSESSPKFVAIWNDLKSYLNKWFYKPDIEAFKIVLCTYVSHMDLEEDPVWLFILGVPGSGKSSILINPLTDLPKTQAIDTLTATSFLSGFGANNGILQDLTQYHDGNGIILFSDFSSFLGLRPDIKSELASQFRKIYDGRYSKKVGSRDTLIEWSGKVTIIAACTPDLEDHWAVNRSLGDRFITLRWKSDSNTNPNAYAEYANKQRGHKEAIRRGLIKRIKAYIDYDTLATSKPNIEVDVKSSGLSSLATLVASMRVTVKRDAQNKIKFADEPECNTRLAQSFSNIAVASAWLDRRPRVIEKDLQLARRLAIDTIPENRFKILKALVKSNVKEARASDIAKVAKLSKWQMKWTLSELVEMKVVECYLICDNTEKIITLTKKYVDLVNECNLINNLG